MPTYEYLCKACGHTFDRFQSMADEPVKECPKCGKDVGRLVGKGVGVIFKGKGFYATDYKGKSSADLGGTCCGRTERCDKPPCSDDRVRER